MTFRQPTILEAVLFVGGVFSGAVAGGLIAGDPGAVAGGLWVTGVAWSYARAQMTDTTPIAEEPA